jgi:hypothetical protein
LTGDVNGDGRADIVGLGETEVYVSFGNTNGTFGAPIASSPPLTKTLGGWTDNNNYPRVVGDVNGDGRADIVGFGDTFVFVSFGNTNGTFDAPIASFPGFTKNVGGWTDNNNYPRVVGDVNGDGRADIVGFGETDVFVSFGNTNGTFGAPIASSPSFTKSVGGWTITITILVWWVMSTGMAGLTLWALGTLLSLSPSVILMALLALPLPLLQASQKV